MVVAAHPLAAMQVLTLVLVVAVAAIQILGIRTTTAGMDQMVL